MKRHEVKDLLPIVKEFAAGTPIQRRAKGCPHLSWEDCGDDCKFSSADEHRIKPTPKPPQYRAWTESEVPVGALIRSNKKTCSYPHMLYLITGRDDIGNLYVRSEWQKAQFALENYEYSINGLPFLPCGILIEE